MKLYQVINNVQAPVQYGHLHETRPIVRIEGSVTREGLVALQQLMRVG